MSADVQTVTSITAIVATVATTVVVLAGAPLAFQKLRNQPRLIVGAFGQWHEIDGQSYLQARVTIVNRSSLRTRLEIVQEGSGLRVSTLAPRPSDSHGVLRWGSQRVYPILDQHAWLEAGEEASQDILLDLGVPAPVITLFEVRFVWRPKRRPTNRTVFYQRIIPIDSKIEESTQDSPNTSNEVDQPPGS